MLPCLPIFLHFLGFHCLCLCLIMLSRLPMIIFYPPHVHFFVLIVISVSSPFVRYKSSNTVLQLQQQLEHKLQSSINASCMWDNENYVNNGFILEGFSPTTGHAKISGRGVNRAACQVSRTSSKPYTRRRGRLHSDIRAIQNGMELDLRLCKGARQSFKGFRSYTKPEALNPRLRLCPGVSQGVVCCVVKGFVYS